MVERRPYNERTLLLERVLTRLYAGSWPAHLWALWPGATRVRLLQHTIHAGRETGRSPLRIAFASDLHLGPTTPKQLLDHAFAEIGRMEADVLALGGDYVFLGATADRVRELKRRVQDVPARTKVAVLGNHDFWARPERLQDALAAIGVEVMVNRGVRLPPPHDDVGLVGLDDPLTGKAEVEQALATVKGAGTVLALCHSPDALPVIRHTPIRLLMCGHTHGGHVALPGGRPLFMPSRVGRRYPWGLHQVDDLALFVSRGVGGSLVPVRTFAAPDVACLTVT
jgi:uncharacterized protein